MKYLLHGDDNTTSRKRISELAEGFTITHFDGTKILPKDFETSLTSNTLFDSKKALIFENIISKNKEKKKIIEVLNNTKSSDLLIFWEGKKVLKTALSGLKDVKIEEYNLPQVYFEFLDSFTPQKVNQLYQMYHLLLLSTEPTQIFYSLIKRLRALLIIQSDGKSIETDKMSPWQLSKLKNQARMWPKDKLTRVYSKLQDMEIRLKSGKLVLGLSQQLDILILSELL